MNPVVLLLAAVMISTRKTSCRGKVARRFVVEHGRIVVSLEPDLQLVVAIGSMAPGQPPRANTVRAACP